MQQCYFFSSLFADLSVFDHFAQLIYFHDLLIPWKMFNHSMFYKVTLQNFNTNLLDLLHTVSFLPPPYSLPLWLLTFPLGIITFSFNQV